MVTEQQQDASHLEVAPYPYTSAQRWLIRAAWYLRRRVFSPAGVSLPRTIHFDVQDLVKGRKRDAWGACSTYADRARFTPQARSAAGHDFCGSPGCRAVHILMHHNLPESLVLPVLVHELVHAAVGDRDDAEHGSRFVATAAKVGLIYGEVQDWVNKPLAERLADLEWDALPPSPWSE